MYDEEIIGMNYKPTRTVRDKIHWVNLQSKYNVKKSFDSIMKRLSTKGYVDAHGKSGDVYSLSRDGVYYVKGKVGRAGPS